MSHAFAEDPVVMTEAEANRRFENLHELQPDSQEFLDLATWLYIYNAEFHSIVFYTLQYQADLWDLKTPRERSERIRILAHAALVGYWVTATVARGH